jgi:hypothetical protein
MVFTHLPYGKSLVTNIHDKSLETIRKPIIGNLQMKTIVKMSSAKPHLRIGACMI